MTTENTEGDDAGANQGAWRKQSRSGGQFTSEIPLDDLREFLNETPPGAGTGEIAEEFGVSPDTARRRCRDLAEGDEIIERPVGPSIFWQVVYWEEY